MFGRQRRKRRRGQSEDDQGLPANQCACRDERGTAINALGDKLPEIAAVYRMDADQLRRVLRHDRHVRVDQQGHLFYEDEFPPLPADAALTVDAAAAVDAYPLADTFRLHSRPGAKQLIYLDFDGYVVSNTAWNASCNGGANIVCAPFDFEGGATVFTDAEKTRIQGIWARVAETMRPLTSTSRPRNPAPRPCDAAATPTTATACGW